MNIGIENYTHECKQCGMKFYNSQELVNHVQKFCTTVGLNSLSGVAKYENSNNLSKKLKNYGAHSLGAMKYEPEFTSSQLEKQAKDLHYHKQQLSINRPYKNSNIQVSNYSNYDNNGFKANYEKSTVRRIDAPQNIQSRAAYGSRLLADSEVSMKPLHNFGRQKDKKFNNMGYNQDNNYYSPPSNQPLIMAKRLGPSVLDKSNTSIAEMSQSQKRDYANDKLVQLDNIAVMYDRGGGMSMQFRKNLQKMKKFYHKMLEENQYGKEREGELSRVQTPINKLRNLDNDQNEIPKKKKVMDILDQQVINDNFRKSKNQTQKRSNAKNQDIQNSNSNKFLPYGGYAGNYPYNGFPPFQQQPQIIMIPPYPQVQPQQTSKNEDVNEQIKYFQKMIEVKNDENKKLMEMLMESKREKNQNNFKQNIQHIRRSRISEIQNKGIYDGNQFHFETPMGVMPTPEEKILLALQREQLDELRLLSSLPSELQEIKMQSVMKLIEQRTQLQKQILSQKLKRLEQQKNYQLYQQKVKMDKDDWTNQQRKRLIGYQMDNVLHHLKKKVNGSESQDEEQENPYSQRNNEEE